MEFLDEKTKSGKICFFDIFLVDNAHTREYEIKTLQVVWDRKYF